MVIVSAKSDGEESRTMAMEMEAYSIGDRWRGRYVVWYEWLPESEELEWILLAWHGWARSRGERIIWSSRIARLATCVLVRVESKREKMGFLDSKPRFSCLRREN